MKYWRPHFPFTGKHWLADQYLTVQKPNFVPLRLVYPEDALASYMPHSSNHIFALSDSDTGPPCIPAELRTVAFRFSRHYWSPLWNTIAANDAESSGFMSIRLTGFDCGTLELASFASATHGLIVLAIFPGIFYSMTPLQQFLSAGISNRSMKPRKIGVFLTWGMPVFSSSKKALQLVLPPSYSILMTRYLKRSKKAEKYLNIKK